MVLPYYGFLLLRIHILGLGVGSFKYRFILEQREYLSVEWS
jgi:hypothetical protein